MHTRTTCVYGTFPTTYSFFFFFFFYILLLIENVFMPICSVMAVPATVLYFTCYDQLRAVLSVKMGDYAQMAPLFAGALARGEFITVTLFKRSQNLT